MKCDACGEAFDLALRRPRSLYCGHTFCNECCYALVSVEEGQCPTCQKDIKVEDASDLPFNFLVEQQLGLETTSQRPPSTCFQKRLKRLNGRHQSHRSLEVSCKEHRRTGACGKFPRCNRQQNSFESEPRTNFLTKVKLFLSNSNNIHSAIALLDGFSMMVGMATRFFSWTSRWFLSR